MRVRMTTGTSTRQSRARAHTHTYTYTHNYARSGVHTYISMFLTPSTVQPRTYVQK